MTRPSKTASLESEANARAISWSSNSGFLGSRGSTIVPSIPCRTWKSRTKVGSSRDRRNMILANNGECVVTRICRSCCTHRESSNSAINSRRRGCTPFSGSSKASSDPLQGFTAKALSARTRSVPSDTIRDEKSSPPCRTKMSNVPRRSSRSTSRLSTEGMIVRSVRSTASKRFLSSPRRWYKNEDIWSPSGPISWTAAGGRGCRMATRGSR